MLVRLGRCSMAADAERLDPPAQMSRTSGGL